MNASSRFRVRFAIVAVLAVVPCLLAPPILGDDTAAPVTDDPPPEWTTDAGRGWRLRLSPGSDLFPRYIADPRRPMFAVVIQSIGSSTIPEAGATRYGIRLGGRYGFLRLHPAGDPDRGFQLALEGAFTGQFDPDNDTDNMAWDGVYGFHIAWAPRHDLALRLGAFHDSAHVGDEYAERTGRERIGYTRQEWALGVSWRMAPSCRFYAETAYGVDLRNDELMRPWRLQWGLEYEPPPRWWRGRMGWYVAGDFSSYEENDWSVNGTIQAGVRLPVSELSRIYRFGLEYYRGRSHYGEFFFHEEDYLGFGFWFDL